MCLRGTRSRQGRRANVQENDIESDKGLARLTWTFLEIICNYTALFGYVDIYLNRFPNTFFYLFLDKRITKMYISQNLNYLVLFLLFLLLLLYSLYTTRSFLIDVVNTFLYSSNSVVHTHYLEIFIKQIVIRN